LTDTRIKNVSGRDMILTN